MWVDYTDFFFNWKALNFSLYILVQHCSSLFNSSLPVLSNSHFYKQLLNKHASGKFPYQMKHFCTDIDWLGTFIIHPEPIGAGFLCFYFIFLRESAIYYSFRMKIKTEWPMQSFSIWRKKITPDHRNVIPNWQIHPLNMYQICISFLQIEVFRVYFFIVLCTVHVNYWWTVQKQKSQTNAYVKLEVCVV